MPFYIQYPFWFGKQSGHLPLPLGVRLLWTLVLGRHPQELRMEHTWPSSYWGNSPSCLGSWLEFLPADAFQIGQWVASLGSGGLRTERALVASIHLQPIRHKGQLCHPELLQHLNQHFSALFWCCNDLFEVGTKTTLLFQAGHLEWLI